MKGKKSLLTIIYVMAYHAVSTVKLVYVEFKNLIFIEISTYMDVRN
jgi:hypothetical protein